MSAPHANAAVGASHRGQVGQALAEALAGVGKEPGASAPSVASSSSAFRPTESRVAASGADPMTGFSTRTEQHENDGGAHELHRRSDVLERRSDC